MYVTSEMCNILSHFLIFHVFCYFKSFKSGGPCDEWTNKWSALRSTFQQVHMHKIWNQRNLGSNSCVGILQGRHRQRNICTQSWDNCSSCVLFVLFEASYQVFGSNIIWTILTVIIVFEDTVGMFHFIYIIFSLNYLELNFKLNLML